MPSPSRALTWFFALTFAATWTCFVAAGVIAPDEDAQGGSRALLFSLLILLGTFAPGIVALLLTAGAGGRNAVRALLRRLVDWRVHPRWFVFALGFMATIKLAVAVIHRVVAGGWPAFTTESVPLMFAAAIFATATMGQAGEEIGWRGFALPRLAERMGIRTASIVLGVIWAVWHLPLFYIPAAETFGQSFPAYLLQVTALSVAMAWLYVHTHGSLLPVMLMHAAINNTKDIVPTVTRVAADPLLPHASRMTWLVLVVLWIVAAGFLIAGRMNTYTAERS